MRSYFSAMAFMRGSISPVSRHGSAKAFPATYRGAYPHYWGLLGTIRGY